ncbi:MAG: 4a-hydroxytetrahydrobiopterin dehydratase [Rhodoferax sp.]
MPKLSAPEREAALRTLPAWQWEPQRDALQRTFVFADFVQAFGFMGQVALLAEKHDHHPEWSNVYQRVQVLWTTHDVGGLSERDVAMAQACDRIAAGLLSGEQP